jgi:hypothetical protein
VPAVFATGFWQPQVQGEQVQLTQVQVIGWVDMIDSSCSGELPC